MTLTSRYPTFLYEALKLQESKIPIDLDSSIISAVIDAYQGGWALATYNHRVFTGSMQFAQTVVVVGADQFPPSSVGIAPEEKQKKVLAMDIQTTLLGDSSFEMRYRRIDGESQEVVLREGSLTAGTDLTRDWLDDIMHDSQGTLWIPPGWQLIVVFPATGVAEDVFRIQILWAEIPAGFNIGFT